MHITERFSKPTRYDKAPYGSVCKYEKEYFIQVSQDPEISNWLTMGDFLLNVFRNSILNEEFILDCLDDYKEEKV